MTSTIASCSSRSTVCPTVTNGGWPGAGATQKVPTAGAGPATQPVVPPPAPAGGGTAGCGATATGGAAAGAAAAGAAVTAAGAGGAGADGGAALPGRTPHP